MIILRYLLLFVAVAGAILTFPNSIVNPFTLVFIGFVGLAWFAWGLGRPKEPAIDAGEAVETSATPR
jgi:apolipoprotein N-acyltransferase